MNAALLTAPVGTLSFDERATALAAAREAGRAAASGPVDPADLEAARPFEYYLHIIAPLLEQGLVSEKSAAGWKLRCLDHRALEDARVQAFLFGWNECALELLHELHGARGGENDDAVRRILEDGAA